MKELFKVKRGSVVGVPHLNLQDPSTGEIINSLVFLRVDGMYAVLKYKETECYLRSTELVYVLKE